MPKYATHTPVPHKTIPAKAGIYFSQAATPLNFGGNAAHGKEIPAYAGMVCVWDGGLLVDFGELWDTTL